MSEWLEFTTFIVWTKILALCIHPSTDSFPIFFPVAIPDLHITLLFSMDLNFHFTERIYGVNLFFPSLPLGYKLNLHPYPSFHPFLLSVSGWSVLPPAKLNFASCDVDLLPLPQTPSPKFPLSHISETWILK